MPPTCKNLLFLVMAVLSLSACATAATSTSPVGPTATSRVIVVTATPEPTATEKPLVGPRATAQALAGQITLVAPTRGPDPDDYVGMLEHAWNLINENYYSDQFNGVDWEAALEEYRPKFAALETQEEFWALMDEFVDLLGDSHSNFRTPEEVSARYGSTSSGSGRPWSGIEMWPPPGHAIDEITLWYVCSIGPAADAGLKRGDRVLAIDGTPLVFSEETDYGAIVRHIMFGDGVSNQLTLTVQQGPDLEPRDVTLTLGGAAGCDGWNAAIVVRAPRIGYIRIADFDSGSDTVLLDMIESLEENQLLDGLILDIRHNPGGNSDADIAIFTEGTFGTVGMKREDRMRTLFKIRGPVKWNDTTPVVLLTDESSHSAADYFALAMKLSGRATLVGMPTAGNTDGWTSFSLPDGSLVGIAVMILELPDGSSIEGVGIEPDIWVSGDNWALSSEPDLQLRAALDLLLK